MLYIPYTICWFIFCVLYKYKRLTYMKWIFYGERGTIVCSCLLDNQPVVINKYPSKGERVIMVNRINSYPSVNFMLFAIFCNTVIWENLYCLMLLSRLAWFYAYGILRNIIEICLLLSNISGLLSFVSEFVVT